MKDTVELVIRPDGVIESVYDDSLKEFATDIGGEISNVCRASNVEWEDSVDGKGWTVRASHDPSLALRIKPDELIMTWHASRDGKIVYFDSRSFAIEEELRFFWQLLEKERRDVEKKGP